MKVLVIGAAGNLGLSLSKLLVQQGHEVYGLCRSCGSLPEGVIAIEQDLRTLDESKLPQVDAVFYLAQSRHFREFPEKFQDIVEINISIPLKIADWARRNNVPSFHYTSSGGVYQSGVVAVRENAEINANRDTGFYIGSRLSAEILLRNFAGYFKTFSIIRPFFVYGPNQAKNMLIPRFVEMVKEGKEITLDGENGIKINPIHVNDAAIACSKLLDLNGFHALNIAGSEIVTIKELAIQIGSLVGKTPVFKIMNNKPQDLIGDTGLMYELLHRPMITLRMGMKDLL